MRARLGQIESRCRRTGEGEEEGEEEEGGRESDLLKLVPKISTMLTFQVRVYAARK